MWEEADLAERVRPVAPFGLVDRGGCGGAGRVNREACRRLGEHKLVGTANLEAAGAGLGAGLAVPEHARRQ